MYVRRKNGSLRTLHDQNRQTVRQPFDCNSLFEGGKSDILAAGPNGTHEEEDKDKGAGGKSSHAMNLERRCGA
jgi:hypothetical protein